MNDAPAEPSREIATPGIYDIPEADYHADPCPAPSLSASIAKLLLDATPRHAWMVHPRLNPKHEPEQRRDFDLGNAAHALMLGDPKKFEILDYENYRKDSAKAAREAAYEAGRLPVLTAQWEQVQAMVKAARAQLSRHAEAADAFATGKPEQTLVWWEIPTLAGAIGHDSRSTANNGWCRARLDFLPAGGNVFYDYKTTGVGAGPDDWGARSLFDLGHDVQAAFYLRGISAVVDTLAAPIFRFVVQETEPPYALAVHELSPQAAAYADRKVEYALAWWRWCTEHNAWPGYAGRVHHIDLPPWHANRQEEREMRMAIAREDNADLFRLMLDWQAPL